MSVNGIWRVEILGPGGWEPVATAFLENGTYKAASEDHYTIGSYEVSGDRIEITGIATYYGKVRTVFGRNEKESGRCSTAVVQPHGRFRTDLFIGGDSA